MRTTTMLLLIGVGLPICSCQQRVARILPERISVEITHAVAVHEGRYCVIDLADVRPDNSQTETTQPSTSNVGVFPTYDDWLAASRTLAEFENDPALLRPTRKEKVVLVIPIGEKSLADAEEAADQLKAKGLCVARQKAAVPPCWQNRSTGP